MALDCPDQDGEDEALEQLIVLTAAVRKAAAADRAKFKLN
jgi:hypothetical protein